MRLRDLGGLIVIDFIDMESRAIGVMSKTVCAMPCVKTVLASSSALSANLVSWR